jgi:hypothetical protein
LITLRHPGLGLSNKSGTSASVLGQLSDRSMRLLERDMMEEDFENGIKENPRRVAPTTGRTVVRGLEMEGLQQYREDQATRRYGNSWNWLGKEQSSVGMGRDKGRVSPIRKIRAGESTPLGPEQQRSEAVKGIDTYPPTETGLKSCTRDLYDLQVCG